MTTPSNLRKSFTQIPGIDELNKILAVESTRICASSKINNYYGDNSYLIALLEYFGLDAGLLSEGVDLPDYLQYSESTKNRIVELLTTPKVSIDSELKEILDSIYDYLSQEDEILENKVYNVAFVFGSANTLRINKAIELYEKGCVKNITISGKKPFYKDSAISEAEELAKYAISKGVPEQDITIEANSITLPDNVKRTLDMWEDRDFQPKSLILIISPFALRRAYTEWQKFPDFEIELCRQACEVSETFSKDGWYKNPTGIAVIVNELFKIQVERNIDLILQKRG